MDHIVNLTPENSALIKYLKSLLIFQNGIKTNSARSKTNLIYKKILKIGIKIMKDQKIGKLNLWVGLL